MPHYNTQGLIEGDKALPGRASPMPLSAGHFVNGRPLRGNWREPLRAAQFGMGCFWGAERLFWQIPGVYVTAVGYAGGFTPNPTYEEVCSGRTGHAETVLVVYNAETISLGELLRHFWENHDPTQYMRQGNDIGSNYRSAIYVDNERDYDLAAKSRLFYAERLRAERQSGAAAKRGEAAYAPIVTELAMNQPFYYAEDYHQQYLAKNPNGYCGLQGTGISCPIG